MAFTIQSYGESTGSTSTTSTVSKPSGLAVGDIMVACIGWSDVGTPTSVIPPSGWTEIHFTATGSTCAAYSAWKIADSSDVAASTFAFALQGASSNFAEKGAILRINGGRQSNVAYVNAEASANSGNTITVGTVTPSVASSLLLFFAMAGGNTTIGSISNYACTNDNPSWAVAFDIGFDPGINAVAIACGYATRAATTVTGNNTASISQSSEWVGHIIAIEPAITASASDSVTVSDVTPLSDLDYNHTDSVTTSEASEASKERLWSTEDKPSTSWTNEPK